MACVGGGVGGGGVELQQPDKKKHCRPFGKPFAGVDVLMILNKSMSILTTARLLHPQVAKQILGIGVSLQRAHKQWTLSYYLKPFPLSLLIGFHCDLVRCFVVKVLHLPQYFQVMFCLSC